MKIIFVRHGEPLKNDYGIADMGKQEMRFLAEYLKQNYHVDCIISATSQRAKESTEILNEYFNMKVSFYDFLSEFKYRLPDELEECEYPWEFPPKYWINKDEMLDYKKVLDESIFSESEISIKALTVWQGLDQILSNNGYERSGNLYKVISGNKKEIVIVTHFATMAVMLAHLWNVSILVTMNMLFMAPSSYTVVSTEEISSGQAIFRCLELGSTKHLFNHNELLSEYGRQDEVKGGKDGKQD